MKIVNPLSPSGKKEDIKTVLYALAGQNNCDGEPYDQMQVCEKIKHLTAFYGKAGEEYCGRKAVIKDIHGRNLCLKCYNKWNKKYLQGQQNNDN